MVTEKLFWDDSLMLEFPARILGLDQYGGQNSIILDRSAFYGEAGGQLGDRGLLRTMGQDIPVTDVQIDDRGRLHHLIQGEIGADLVGQAVTGVVDETHRRDQMSQHTGQHLLSCAFVKLAGGATISSRLGKTTATLDIDLPELDVAKIYEIEDLVNRVILEDRPIHIRYPDREALDAMALRRTPKVTENIRIIEVEDFDLTPCGGTHCSRTGQVGPVFVLGHERYKGKTRVTFLAGRRTLMHQRLQDATLRELASLLGCGAMDVVDPVVRLREDLLDHKQMLGKSRAELANLVAADLWLRHPPGAVSPTLILAVREGEDLAAARTLAHALAKRSDVVALVVSRERGDSDWRVACERAEGLTVNLGVWLRTWLTPLGGRGGGRQERAEGSLPADWDPSVTGLPIIAG